MLNTYCAPETSRVPAIPDFPESPLACSYVADIVVLPSADPLPLVPAMAATLLQLDLLLQESPLDLKAISEVILSDPGATLGILRLAAEEYPNAEHRPVRIEECLASLNLTCWYQAISREGLVQNERLATEWQRCRRVAESARELAWCLEGVSPDEAYLVGLLHRLGEFPRLLEWGNAGAGTQEYNTLGVMLADLWQLPSYLACALKEQYAIGERQLPSAPVLWGELLRMAGQLAEPLQDYSALAA